MAGKIRVVIVDDSELVRRTISLSLGKFEELEIVAQFGDGYTAISMLQRLQVDLIVMDLRMQGIDGITATRESKNLLPEVKVLILSGHDSDDEVLAAFAAGADGYCRKGISASRLRSAIEAVINGWAWIDPALAKTVFHFAAEAHLRRLEQDQPFVPDATLLSLQELDVLAHMAKGCSNEEIAAQMEILVDNVKSCLRSIVHKLASADRTKLAVRTISGDVCMNNGSHGSVETPGC